MKRFLLFVLALVISAPALAADVVTTLAVKYNGQPIYTTTNTFHGMTDEQAAALEKTGMPVLDFGSRRQNKDKCNGCEWSIEWTWGSQPSVLTENMTYNGVVQTLRQATRWLDDRVTAAEINRQRGKKKPWGN